MSFLLSLVCYFQCIPVALCPVDLSVVVDFGSPKQWFVAAAAPELITGGCNQPFNPLWGKVMKLLSLGAFFGSFWSLLT